MTTTTSRETSVTWIVTMTMDVVFLWRLRTIIFNDWCTRMIWWLGVRRAERVPTMMARGLRNKRSGMALVLTVWRRWMLALHA